MAKPPGEIESFAIALLIACGAFLNMLLIISTFGIGWFYYVMIPCYFVSLFFYYIMDSTKLFYIGDLTYITYVIMASPSMVLLELYWFFLASKYYKNSKDRGYFLPTRRNKQNHVIRKLSGN